MIFTTFVAAMLAQSAASEARDPPPVVAYSAGVLDLARGAERFIRNHQATDCSTDTMWCVDGEVMRLAVGKECQAHEIGETFTVGSIVTTVLNADSSSLGQRYVRGGATQPLYLLGDPERPWIVYAYEMAGVTSLFYDVSRRVDLVGIARQDGLQELIAAGDYWTPLVTFDAYGTCTGR